MDDLDREFQEMREERAEWEADFDKRIDALERSSFPRRIAESAFDLIMAELCRDGSTEFDANVQLPDPAWVARKAWEFADSMDTERKKRDS